MDVVVNVLFIGIAESCLRYDDEETCLGREKCRFGTLASCEPKDRRLKTSNYGNFSCTFPWNVKFK